MKQTTDQQENLGYLLVFAGGALWATIGLFITELGKLGLSIEMIAFLRVAFATLIMFVLTVGRYGLQPLKISHKELVICFLLGIICHGIYNILYNIAVIDTGVAVSAVLLDIAPALTLIFSMFLFHEKTDGRKNLAIGINIIGCILAATGGNFSSAALPFFGLLAGAGAGFCYALTAIIGRLAGSGSNSFVVSTYSYLAAAICLFPMVQTAEFPTITASGYLLSAGFALIPTAIAYVLYYEGIFRIPSRESSKVPVIASIETVLSIVFGVLLYSEPFNSIKIIGSVLVIASIVLMSRN